MNLDTTTLTRAAGLAAVAAGLLFICVQVGHPHVDLTSITTTEMTVRTTVKLVMAALVLVGITGMYLHQVRRNGLLGLVGYLVFGAGYLMIMCTTFVAGYVVPSLVDTDPAYAEDVIEVATGGSATGDLGALGVVFQLQGAAYLGGGLLFGIALYRAGVLTRWAAALLAVAGLVSAALSVMPDAFYRFLAFPNGIAMVALGWSLWRVATVSQAPAPMPVEVGAR
ncbi:hypothetical protein [Nocardioides caldifontis]|uniref:hypothetical protein n=1 Tax=Nocardioides caldifontis TaxID=2588938 RepID=UPI0011E00C27|nr:hypothetical protein [Nocardioides caldifontis]